MIMELRRLDTVGIGELDVDIRSGKRKLAVDIESLPLVARDVPGGPMHIGLGLLDAQLDECHRRFAVDGRIPAESDKWLAPRLHASLRLTRQEASDPEIWAFLAIIARPDYVLARFPGNKDQPPTADRYASHDRRKQAFARLWWGAEIFRNGPDYSAAYQAFTMQDVPNMMNYLCFENRPLAVALIQKLAALDATSAQVQDVGRRIRLWLAATSLDTVAPDHNTDPDRVWSWVTDATPKPISSVDLPEGPDDGEIDPVSAASAGRLADAIIRLVMPVPAPAPAPAGPAS